MKDRARRWYSLSVQKEIQESRALWEEIFPEDSKEFLDYYDQWKCKDNEIATRHASGALVSMIHWNPYEVQMGAETVDSSYLIAVATRPEHRHRGLMRGLLREGMEVRQEDETPFVFLMPADPAIYTPFGFRYFYDRSVVEILQPMQQNWFGSEQVDIRPIRKNEMALAADFANRELAQRFDLYPIRSEEYLMRLAAECQSEGGDLEGIFHSGELVGLLSWWGDETIEVRDLILTSEWEMGACRDIWRAAFCKHWQDAQKIKIITTGQEGEAEPIIMGRITDAGAFARGVRASEPVEMHIRLEDPLIEENCGDFLWKVSPECSEWMSAKTMEKPEELECREPDLAMNIEDFFGWLTGYRSLSTLDGVKMGTDGMAKAEKIRVMRGAFFTEIV